MANENHYIVVSQTVHQVMEQFVAVMRADPEIPNDAISRLETLLHKGEIPKSDQINAALFGPPPKG